MPFEHRLGQIPRFEISAWTLRLTDVDEGTNKAPAILPLRKKTWLLSRGAGNIDLRAAVFSAGEVFNLLR